MNLKMINNFNFVKPIVKINKFNNSYNKTILHNEKSHQDFLVDYYKNILPINLRYYNCMRDYHKKNE